MLNFYNSLASSFSFLSYNNEVLETHNNKLIWKCWHVINTAIFLATLGYFVAVVYEWGRPVSFTAYLPLV